MPFLTPTSKILMSTLKAINRNPSSIERASIASSGSTMCSPEGTDNFFPPPEGHPYNKPGTDNGAFPPESLNSEPLQIMPGYAAAEHCWVYPHEMYEM